MGDMTAAVESRAAARPPTIRLPALCDEVFARAHGRGRIRMIGVAARPSQGRGHRPGERPVRGNTPLADRHQDSKFVVMCYCRKTERMRVVPEFL